MLDTKQMVLHRDEILSIGSQGAVRFVKHLFQNDKDLDKVLNRECYGRKRQLLIQDNTNSKEEASDVVIL